MNSEIVIDYNKLKHFADDCGNAFASHGECQVCTIDDFLQSRNESPYRLDEYFQAPEAISAELALPRPLRQLIWELHSGTCMVLLDQLLAMEGLLPDPGLHAGGFIQPDQQTPSIAFPPELPDKQLQQRLSLLACLGSKNEQHIALNDSSGKQSELACSAGRVMLFKNSANCRFQFANLTQEQHAQDSLYLLLHYYAQADNHPGI